MASLKTDALSSLTAVTTPSDTDLIPVGTGNGNVLKKLTWSNFIEAVIDKVNTDIVDSLITLKSFSIPISSSNQYVASETNIALSGYRPIAIGSFQSSDSYILFTKLSISGNTLYGRYVKTNASGSWSGTIVYLKN